MKKERLGNLVNIKTGKLDANAMVEGGKYPFFTTSKKISRIDSYAYDDEVVLVAGNGDLNVKYYEGKFNAYQRTYILTTKDPDKKLLNLKYLYYFLDSYLDILRSQSIGGVIKYIKLSNLTEILIPLYSMETQKKIVDSLDLVLTIIEKRKEQLAEMDRLVQSYYSKIIRESSTKKVVLKDIVQKIITGKSYSSQENGKYKVLKTSSVSYGNFNPKEFKNLPFSYIPKKEHIVSEGDVLVSRMNTVELVGAVAYVWKDYDNLAVPDRIWKLKTTGKVDNLFLWKTLNQEYVKDSIRGISSGTSGSMKNISQKNFLELSIDLPNLSQQLKFTSMIEEIESQKKIMKLSLTEMENNFNALLQKAFKGELFPE